MSNSTTFDPNVFAETAVEGEMSTRFEPVEEGDYEAFIEKFEVREVNNGGVVLDVHWSITDEELKSKMNLENITIRQGIFLDIEDGKLVIGPNKNIKLGRLREALGQNKSGKPWSFNDLTGAGPCTIHVTQRPDKNDPTVIYNDVGRVSAA